MNQLVNIGNRIPKEYFITSGSGESDITIHAGSYHLALKDAGIEQCNIISYSSILPAIAKEIPKTKKQIHGSVMETISAVANAKKGEMATAGIIYGWIYNKKTKEKYGGLVCEYNGKDTEKKAAELLKASLNELYVNGFSEDYDLKEIKLITKSIIPKKKYGTALVAICFMSYVIPIL